MDGADPSVVSASDVAADTDEGLRHGRDFVAVLALVHKHPVSAAQMALMLDNLAELSKQAAFREWFGAPDNVPDETVTALVANVYAHWELAEQRKVSPAVLALRNLCACRVAVQHAVVEQPRGLSLLCAKLGAGSKLAAMCLSNAVTQNARAASTLLCSMEFTDGAVSYAEAAVRGDGKAAVLCTVLYNCWCACGQGLMLIARLLPLLEPRCEDDATGPACLVRALLEQPVGAVVAAPSARALFAAVNAFPRTLGRAGVPERVMQALLAARQLPELPALLDALAMACASDEADVRRACLEMSRRGLLELCCELLDEPACPAINSVLQLLGNVIFRNDEWICERLLQLGGFNKILRHSRFNPAMGPTREWALVAVRNATEVSPAVHAALSELQVMGLDRSDGTVDALEAKLGGRLSISKDGKIAIERRAVRVAIATSAGFATLTAEDVLLRKALVSVGCEVDALVWTDASVQWLDWDAVVVRTVWDYHHQPDAFLAWVTRVSDAGVALLNPPDVLRWNHHKRYLFDLQQNGVPIVPSVLLAAGAKVNLPKAAAGLGDAKFYVVKPCVGSFGEGVAKVALSDGAAIARALQQQSSADCLLQPFVASIGSRGEVSCVFIGGQLSHAVLKVPPGNNFKVQGGTVTLLERVDDAAVSVARKAMACMAVLAGCVYARVDLVWHDGQFCVSELEALDPELFLLRCRAPQTVATALATAIRQRINKP